MDLASLKKVGKNCLCYFLGVIAGFMVIMALTLWIGTFTASTDTVASIYSPPHPKNYYTHEPQADKLPVLIHNNTNKERNKRKDETNQRNNTIISSTQTNGLSIEKDGQNIQTSYRTLTMDWILPDLYNNLCCVVSTELMFQMCMYCFFFVVVAFC